MRRRACQTRAVGRLTVKVGGGEEGGQRGGLEICGAGDEFFVLPDHDVRAPGSMVSDAKEERSPGGVRGSLSRRADVVDSWTVTDGQGPVVLGSR
jgi:hypothetical protein